MQTPAVPFESLSSKATVSRLVWAVILVGGAIRVVLAFRTRGVAYDLQSYALVGNALVRDPLHVYAAVNTPVFRWPYPSGYFPFIRLAGTAAHRLGLSFTSLIRMPMIVADLLMAWIVQDFLGRRGAGEAARIGAAAAIALGPLFIANSGYHGQIDSLAILPAVAAIAWWDRLPDRSRALAAGALVGLGGAFKTVPLLMIVPLLASCRSVREGITLIASAAGVMVIAMAPFVIADPKAAWHVTDYHSLFGLGGLSLLVQPRMADAWLSGAHLHYNVATNALQGHLGLVIVVVTIGFACLLVLYRRPAPVEGALLLWLTAFAFSINWGPRYAIWGLPFFVMAGHIWKSVALQVALLVASVLIYAKPVSSTSVHYLYLPLMLGSLAAFIIAAAITARGLIAPRDPDAPIGHLQPA